MYKDMTKFFNDHARTSSQYQAVFLLPHGLGMQLSCKYLNITIINYASGKMMHICVKKVLQSAILCM